MTALSESLTYQRDYATVGPYDVEGFEERDVMKINRKPTAFLGYKVSFSDCLSILSARLDLCVSCIQC